MAGDSGENGLDVFWMHARDAHAAGPAARCADQVLGAAWGQAQVELGGLARVAHQRLHVVEQGLGQEQFAGSRAQRIQPSDVDDGVQFAEQQAAVITLSSLRSSASPG